MAMKINKRLFDSVNELEEYLKNQDTTDVILLGEDSIVKNSAYALSIIDGDFNVVIGLTTTGGLMPEYVIINDAIFVGYNSEISIIKHGKLINRIVDDAPFYEFMSVSSIPDCVIAIFELGVFCVNANGSVKWRYISKDIITNSALRGDLLTISTEADNLEIDIYNGEIK